MSEQYVKIYQFKLNSSATEQGFLAVSRKLDTDLKNQEGFLYRSLAKQNDATWQDIIYWDNSAAAAKMAEVFEKSSDAGIFLSLIDMPSVMVTESTVVTANCSSEASEVAA